MVLKSPEQIQNLLNEDEKLDERFNAFVNGVRGVEEKMRINFAGELHFSNPHNTGSGPIGFGIQMPIPVHFPWWFRKKSIYLETPRERHMRVGRPWHKSGRLASNEVSQIWDREHSEWMYSWPVFMRFTCTRFFESNYPMNLIESSPTYLS